MSKHRETVKKPFTSSDEQKLCQRAWDALQCGQLTHAEQHCRDLLIINPRHSEGHCLLGEVHIRAGRPNEAIKHLTQAIKHKPDLAVAYSLLGTAHRRAAQMTEAMNAYKKAIALNPEMLDAYFNLGITLTDLGKYQEAVDQYQKLLAIQPKHADSYHGLGLCMEWLGDLNQAAEFYEQGLRLNAEHIGIWNNIASVYLALNRTPEALDAFRKSADLKHNHGNPVKGPRNIILHRIRHDAAQLRYIDANTGLPEEHKDYLAALSELESKHIGKPGTDRVMVDEHTLQRIAPSFNRIIHRAGCPEIPGGALNPDIDWAACELAYTSSTPEVVTVDSFLRPEALQSLRKYCLESTVWKSVRPYGYMGALITDGFATPLLLQIISELRERMPAILSEHHLGQAWAYKYDNSLRAINIHADCAAVNINFWITPDSANKNPHNGGLVLWDKAPPPDWGLARTQNPDKSEIIQYLESSGSRTITVPHRQNRMVLFNSALFHKSDEMEFRDGYENRRINITLLYGNGLQ